MASPLLLSFRPWIILDSDFLLPMSNIPASPVDLTFKIYPKFTTFTIVPCSTNHYLSAVLLQWAPCFHCGHSWGLLSILQLSQIKLIQLISFLKFFNDSSPHRLKSTLLQCSSLWPSDPIAYHSLAHITASLTFLEILMLPFCCLSVAPCSFQSGLCTNGTSLFLTTLTKIVTHTHTHTVMILLSCYFSS